MDSTSVPTCTAAPAARHSVVAEHTGPTIAVLPDLRSWNWFQTLLFGSFTLSLGGIVPGMSFFMCD